MTLLKQVLSLLIYADDTTLYSTIFYFESRDIQIISSLINVELYKINEWLMANKVLKNLNLCCFTCPKIHTKTYIKYW